MTLQTKSRGRLAPKNPPRPQGMIVTRFQEFPEPEAFPWPVDPYTLLPVTQSGEPAVIHIRKTPRRHLEFHNPFYQGSHARVNW